MRNMKYCVCLLIIIICLKLSSSECPGGYKDGSLRLLNGSTNPSQNGQAIQICFGNTWIYICDHANPYYQWDVLDATVACRELGYKSGMAGSFQLSPTEPTRYIGYQTSCTGIESKLSHCGSRKLLNQQCSRRASVQCSNSLARQSHCSYGDLRQVGSTQILEICIHGRWRKLCSKFWSIEQTQVVCRQLEQSPDTTTVMNSSSSLIEYHFHCSREENSLIDCILTSLDSSSCGNALDNTYYNCSELEDNESMTFTIQQSRIQICPSTTQPSVAPAAVQKFDTFSLIIIIGFGLGIALIVIISIIITCVLSALKRNKMTLSDNAQHNTKDMSPPLQTNENIAYATSMETNLNLHH